MDIYKDPHKPDCIFLRVGVSTIRWSRVNGEWIAESADLPKQRQSVEFNELPEDLKEEVLASSVRAKTLDSSNGVSR